MTSILLVGVNPGVQARLQPRIESEASGTQALSDPQQALAWVEDHRADLLAVVVGAQVDEPVRLAQRIHRVDREVAVLILSDHQHFTQVSHAIQFTPFLGDHVTTHPTTDVPAIAETLREAVVRGRQRRQFRNTIATVNEQLKTLSAHRVSAIQYLDHVLDHAPVGVVALDPGGHIISSNRRAGEILEQRERHLLGTLLRQVFPEDEKERLRTFIEQVRCETTQSLTEVFSRQAIAGDVRFVAVTAATLPLDPDETGTLVILQDVTSEIINKREREAALRLRDEFLSVAAHELKTPLTSIKGFVDLLGRQVQHCEWDYARIVRLHEQLHSQVDRLELLVMDLLDASRIQQGQLSLRPEQIDLVVLAQRVLQRFVDVPLTTPKHELVLDAPEPVTGVWDPDRIDQVITNLVSNAIKYSPDGGEIRVAIRYQEAQAELVVHDHGVGIDQDLQSRLFQPFMRGDIRGNVPGTGLGLHIISKIIEQHNGTISVSSTPGEGSTFTVQLPSDYLQPYQAGDPSPSSMAT